MGDADIFDRVFTRVCHVKTGYEDRERHIRREFVARGVPVNFYLDYDVADIGRDDLDSYPLPAGVTSLALKHVGIWRAFLGSGLPHCLVFEDDVFLAKDFVQKLHTCINELGERDAVVYLGNAGNYYIPYFDLKKGKTLYPAKHGRCTDSYLITRAVAEKRLAWLADNRFHLGIDQQSEYMDRLLGIPTLWFERPIVEQGTHTGAFRSSLPGGKTDFAWFRRLQWQYKKFVRKLRGHSRESW